MTAIPCALCGSNAHLVAGRTGNACFECLGEAAKQMLAKQNVPSKPSLTASDRCLLCGDPITSGFLAASRGPYQICHGCIVDAIESLAVPIGTESFIQVDF